DVARAQAPVGPLSPPPPGTMPAAKPREAVPLPAPRQSIVGAWKLNRDESDDMRKRAEDSRGSGGGRRGGGGWPGGGGYGGRRGGKMSRTFELSPDGRQLCENLRIESSGGKHRSLDVHYVYDILAQADRK